MIDFWLILYIIDWFLFIITAGTALYLGIFSIISLFNKTTEISKAKIEPSRVVFHCFGYGVEEVDVLNKLGYYISFSGTSTFKRFDIETIKHANLDKLLIETDCPFLAPASHRGQKNEPSFLREIATFDANILGMSEKDFCELTYNNTIRFYGIGK